MINQDSLQAFWRGHLAGITTFTPLVVTNKYHQINGLRQAQEMVCPPQLTADLQIFAHQYKLNIKTLFLTAWAIVLNRYNGRPSAVLLGIADTHILPLAISFPTQTTASWLQALQSQIEAVGQQAAPLDKIAQWGQLSPDVPLFQSVFSFTGSLEADYPLVFHVQETPELRLVVRYDTGWLETAVMARLLVHLQTALIHLINPDLQSIHHISILAPSETQQIVREWNATQMIYNQDIGVCQMFDEWAERVPDHTAVIFSDQSLTYCQLQKQANQLAHYLQKQGVGPDSLVAISLERSPEMAVAVLGVLKAGGAYVPVDPAYPPERITFMLQDTRASVLLTQQKLLEILPPTSAHVLCLDSDWEKLEEGNHTTPVTAVAPQHLAYVIYTSGSTGKPKGVALTHQALTNLITWQLANSPLSVGDKTLQFASLSFDVSFQELFSTWCSGGTLVLISEALRQDMPGLLRLIVQEKIARLFLPFIALQHLADASETYHIVPTGLREIMTAGEQLQMSRSITHLFKSLPHCQLHNQYGPSESHVVSIFTLTGTADLWPALPPIGRPIANTQLYILDSAGQPVPVGVPGELYIGGVALARGYLNRPGLTAERFIPNPFRETVESITPASGRIYKTGDLACYLPDGNIEFLGRIDQQVKIRGFRIELGEIESALAVYPAIQQVVVMPYEDESGEKRLVAYLVAHEGIPYTISDLVHYLQDKLPAYMIPAQFMPLKTLPKTPSGKIDRRTLPAPSTERPNLAQTYIPPQDNLEQTLVQIWCQLLKLDKVGTQDNFFELGGNSLLNTQVATRIQQELGVELPVIKLFQYPTIHALARYLRYGDTEIRPRNGRSPALSNKDHDGIAIIGMVGRFPGANNVEELWQNLAAGLDTVTFFRDAELDPHIDSRLRHDPQYVKARGTMSHADKFDAAFFGMTPREAEIMDPQQRVFLELAWAALETAGYDPATFDGLMGVYAGAGDNTYYTHNIIHRPDLFATIGEFQLRLANEKDYIATRTAYKLNLKGPAVSIHTACSTSLVAVSQAFHSLKTFQCDLALAGGVSIPVPQNSGYLYQEGGMNSGDGYTRSFDAQAQGTVFGSGAGVVVLRRLEDAMADGDHILAVIRGVGVNNDGANKVSFSAPSITGQAEAIRMAYTSAHIHPETISYIEGHGTATPMGDPIEIEALTLAFRAKTEQKQFCAIGSIKSNIGHVVAASGVAGLIKTVLAMQYEQLPPSLHFDMPNPLIDFDNSPFYVNTKLMEWKKNGRFPRRAGVSSFGVGGTNAHVVVEEAPFIEPSSSSRPWQVLLLSARTQEGLAQTSYNLQNFLQQHPATNVADAAYTLQIGRQGFNYRRFVVCQGVADAIQTLETQAPQQMGTRYLERLDPPLVFMFPGQGAQYINMGRNLYEQEPVFREAVDQCATIVRPFLPRDLRDVLYPVNAETAESDLRQTQFTQPALFVTEYALAQLWLSWGLQPQAMIGHSIGEFVAACLAGVFSLEDALFLITTRAQLMQSLPGGSMLSVRLPAARLEGRLSQSMGLAAINGPSLCVVAGPTAEISQLRQTLELEGVVCRELHTSHAFHSPMMETAVSPFVAAIQKVHLSPPRIPILSTVTADWLTPAQATDPLYWAQHMRATVRFAEGVQTLWQQPERVLLEVGPRTTTATLARQQARDLNKQVAIASLGETADDQQEWAAMMKAVGQLWLVGVTIDWQRFYIQERRYRIPLPTYPFERKRHWIEPGKQEKSREWRTESSESPPPQNGGTMFAASVSRQEHLVSELRHLFEDISGLDISQVEGDVTFLEMGLDSLFLTQISLALKNKYRVTISFRQLLETYPTLKTLAIFLDSQLPPDAVPASATVLPTFPLPDSVAPATGEEGGSALERVIAQQLQVMTQQLEMLRNAGIASLPSASKPTEKKVGPTSTKPLPFGAIARIETTQTSDLTLAQQAFLREFTARYNGRTRKSKEYTQTHRAHYADPRTVTGFKPAMKELVYPIVTERSSGCRLWDVDGNEYVDALNGFGSNFFGYQPPFITEVVEKQWHLGTEIGPQPPLAGEVAQLICELTGMDRAGFCNTGSEAVLAAMRVARTHTGRAKIAIFTGSYHGIFDEVIVRGTKTLRSVPAAPGVLPESVQNVLVLDYGTPETLQILRERSHELAAVMVEPVQSRRPDFQPREFLQEVRRITQESGALLIFDEVITGFRCHPGGAQALFGIQADVATYGKVIGGGMPIGVVAGKRPFIDTLDGGWWQYGDDSVPEAGVTYFAGTFVRHPLALAAAKAALLYLKAQGSALQAGLNAETTRLTDELNRFFQEVRAPLHVVHFSSLFRVKFDEERPYNDLLFYLIREKGVHIYDGFPCFLTLAHTPADVDFIIRAIQQSVTEMQAHGFLPAPPQMAGPIAAPTTEAQQEIWLSVQMGDDANCAFNEAMNVWLRGDVQAEAIQTAVQQLANRYEALRTTFSLDGSTFTVAPSILVELPVIDLSQLTAVERKTAVSQYQEQEVLQPFDLVAGPIWRVKLLKLSPQEYVLLFTIHHIMGDGWSIAVLLGDLGRLYEAAARGTTADLPSIHLFSDYARFLAVQENEIQKDETYWLNQFAEMVPIVDLPTDRPRPALRTYDGHREDRPLDSDLVVALKRAGARYGCTFFTTLFSAFNAFLYRLTGQGDLVVGIPAAGQSVLGQDYLVGHCVNMLPVRILVKGEQPFVAYMQEMRQVVVEVYEHQQYTFGNLLKKLPLLRDPSRIPLVPVTFNIDQEKHQLQFGGLEAVYDQTPRRYENFEFSLNAVDSSRGFTLECSYNRNLFDQNTIKRYLEAFETWLRGIVEDPNTPIVLLPVLSSTERQQLLIEWNQTTADFPSTTIHQLFESQAQQTPQATAVRTAVQQLTYQQLNERSNQLAHYLRHQGIGANDLVAIYLNRSVEMVVALLGILKAGAAYLPLDPDYPVERLTYMLQDSGAVALITNQQIYDLPLNLPPIAGRQPEIIKMDADGPTIAREAVTNPEGTATPDHLAYVIYTSGSTGHPKGAMIPHRAIMNHMYWMQTTFHYDSSDRILQKTPTSFDASVWEFWAPLLSGGQLILAQPDAHRDANYLRQTIQKYQITTLQLVPSQLQLLLDEGGLSQCHSLRRVFCGGEALPAQLINRFYEMLPDVPLYNLYGPTETAIDTTIWFCQRRDKHEIVPIGRPINNVRTYILDKRLRPVPVGVLGELFVGGAGVGQGYRHRPGLTAQIFMPDPFSLTPGACMYRTGDLVRYLSNGEIQFWGRADGQVKVRGFRIELGEIEATLQEHPGVRETAVLLREDGGDQARLVAYVVPDLSNETTTAQPDLAGQVAEWKKKWDILYTAGNETAVHSTISANRLDDVAILSEWAKVENLEEQAQEWLSQTLARIRHLAPQRVLEIGCGTGQILLEIAPNCTYYLGTDYAELAVQELQKQLAGANLPQVELMLREANNFTDISAASFDVVIINSVTQYFPNNHYLQQVIEGAVRATAPGGYVYVGDVQSYALLELFHTADQAQRSPTTMPILDFKGIVWNRVYAEEELVVDPGFFYALARQLPMIQQVETFVRRGHLLNETTQFHYDVLLYVDTESKTTHPVTWHDWVKEGWTLESLVATLQMEKPDLYGLSNIPNARLQRERQLFERLHRSQNSQTVGDITADLPVMPGVDPETLWSLAETLPYAVEIWWADSSRNGRFDAIFRRRNTPAMAIRIHPLVNDGLPLSQYTNNPLLKKQGLALIPQLRSHLQAHLPQYMIPSQFILLESLPRTSGGKLDRRALPVPLQTRVETAVPYVPPHTPVEQIMVSIWADILGVEQIGVHDNFFELGGHSLLGIQMVSRIRSSLQAQVPLRILFESPTVAELVSYLLKEPEERQRLEKTAEWLLKLSELPEGETKTLLIEATQVSNEELAQLLAELE